MTHKPPPGPARALAVVALLVLLMAAGGSPAQTQRPRGQQQAQPQAPQAQAQPAAPVGPGPVHPLTQAAQRAGVSTCAGRINQVANFIASDPNSSAYLFPLSARPNDSMVSASFEVPVQPGITAYASASFVPQPSQNCVALYETVVYWPAPCPQVAQANFAQMRVLGNVRQNIAVLEGGSTLRVFLMPAATGCLSIKKELVGN